MGAGASGFVDPISGLSVGGGGLVEGRGYGRSNFRSRSLSSRNAGAIWFGVTCDICNCHPIRGPRHKCQECPDFDACQECWEGLNDGSRTHIEGHTFRGVTEVAPNLRGEGRELVMSNGTVGMGGNRRQDGIGITELQMFLTHMELQMVTLLIDQQQRSLQSALAASMEQRKTILRPAKDSAVRELKRESVAAEVMKDQQCCSVCLCDWEEDSSTATGFEVGVCMPCGHVFHEECLGGWLKRQNTCPVCRREIEAGESYEEDEDEVRVQGGGSSIVRGEGNGEVEGRGDNVYIMSPRTAGDSRFIRGPSSILSPSTVTLIRSDANSTVPTSTISTASPNSEVPGFLGPEFGGGVRTLGDVIGRIERFREPLVQGGEVRENGTVDIRDDEDPR